MNLESSIKIALIGGGTGGHIYPLIAVAEALKREAGKRGIACELVYFGRAKKFRADLARAGIRIASVCESKWRSYSMLRNIPDLFLFGIGFLEALYHMIRSRPHVIFSKGGPGTLPIVFASRIGKTPLIIHESDAIPGKSNLIASRFALKIELAFPEAAQYFKNRPTAVVGLPIRHELLTLRENPATAKQTLRFDPQKPLLFILCGSQGAKRINEFVSQNLEALLTQFQILHQTGKGNVVSQKTFPGYRAIQYLDVQTLGRAFSAADYVLSRAGATALFEIAAFGKPAILVPLPVSAHNHQMKNALAYATSEVASVIEEKTLSIDVFLKTVENMKVSPRRPGSRFFTPRAAELIANDILDSRANRRL